VTRSRTPLVGILVAIAGGCAKPDPQYGPNYALTDDDIAAYATKASDQSFRGPDGVIGVHHGTKVVADFHSFDDGRLTVIVHYDAQPGEACERAGGAVRSELVPVAITAVETPFCIPEVLVERNITFGR
jgi:hypothetical protein